jgi:uncharacterized protein YgbK (DUF1537 family)
MIQMKPQLLGKDDLFAALPPEWPHDPMPEIQRRIAASPTKVVVLDDDPTGTQTVHGVPVLTEWPVESLRREFGGDGRCFFILTNSRSLPPEPARALNGEIARNLLAAAAGKPFVVVSRSDSTLRGHFPLETDALSEVLGPFDGVLLVPFFETGGRHTINDVHYLAEGAWLMPVAQSQFARDATFGYHNSNLRDWVEEKSGGRIRAEDVASISIERIRQGGPEAVSEELKRLGGSRTCVVNVASGRDLLVFVLGLLEAEAAGKRFIYRTAASFAAARAGIVPRPLLTADELFCDRVSTINHPPSTINSSTGGLVVVGSYVPTSSEQLRELIAGGHTANVELDVRAVLADETQSGELARALAAVNEALAAARDTVLYTSRDLVTGCGASDSLAICRRVSASLMEVLERIAVRPRFVVAKGGITSSDVATGPLGVKRAEVLGQILPGVPLWRMGAESRWPGLIYVSFPGNLGGPTALVEVVEKLSGNREIGTIPNRFT